MLDGLDWIIVGVIAVVIIMWGPQKIPEFARSLGRAKGEFDKAQREFTNAALTTEPAATANVAVAAPKQTITTKDKMLLEAAQKLGIATDGKTREQISEEISVKAKLLSAD
ncbi:MAG TPA: twin-arginine translocase TatA/TatE family subunit [Candidatus Limnocylindrales bacterium]|nr:twin-arginine translocase TatA/TatE family subunit [Candidatus Limnocylindrales bacterium]